MNPQCNCEKQEYDVSHSITIGDLKHKHDQCECWSITKERHFQANIKHFETLLTIWLYACEIEAYSKTPQNSKFILDTRANIFPENTK